MTVLDYDRLHELFEYRDGQLYWKQPAGTMNERGYVRVCVDGRMVPIHRVIYMMFNNKLPEQIDHINGIKADNRIENLREATHAQNVRNRPSSKNTSGYKNVSWNVYHKKWEVRVSGKSFGVYKDLEEAGKIAKEARIQLHGEFANHDVE